MNVGRGIASPVSRDDPVLSSQDSLAVHDWSGRAGASRSEMIGPDVTMTLWGCVFEDFLGQDWDDDRNFVDVYLNRRGWKEGLRNSAYMRALKALVMSLYKPPISNPIRA